MAARGLHVSRRLQAQQEECRLGVPLAAGGELHRIDRLERIRSMRATTSSSAARRGSARVKSSANSSITSFIDEAGQVVARRRAGDLALRAQRRAARRSITAGAGESRTPPAARRRLGLTAPARRSADRTQGARDLSRPLLPHAAGDLRVRLRRDVRRKASAG